MDFAKKILGKYGWKEGDGLGKNNNGIAAPLKASLKFDNAGLGVDRATEFNDHWWERCFNEAASNVSVQVEQNGAVSTARKAGEEAVEISTKGYSARKLKKAREHQQNAEGGAVYEHFLKSALLTQSGGEVANEERIRSDDIAVTKVTVLTDEELFKACGGRTAHKGARHGLKLSGKLARLEQQEQEMLAKLLGKKQAGAEESNQAAKKKNLVQIEPELETTVDLEESEPTKSKKKKRKQELAEQENEENAQLPEEPAKSKKRKRKDKLEEANETELQLQEETTEAEPTKSKKKKRKDKDQESTENESEQQPPEVPAKSKKKKSKRSS